MLGDEVSIAVEPLAGALDLDDHDVVQERVEHCGRDNGIAEDLSPFGEAAVGCEDHGRLSVPGVDGLEEQAGATNCDRKVADIINKQQGGPSIEGDLLGQLALAFGPTQRRDQFGQGCAVKTPTGFQDSEAKGCGQVRLACARWPDEVDDLGPPDEVELDQSRDPFVVERRLESDVEAFQRLCGQELGGTHGQVNMARLLCRVFLAQEFVHGLDRDDLAFLQLLQRMIEGFERSGHLQPD